MFDRSPIPPARPGRGVLARTVEGLRDAASRLSRARPGPGMLGVDTPSGLQSRLAGPSRFRAAVTSSGNPYSFVEVAGVAGGTWRAIPGGRAGSDLYELNNTPIPAGSIVEVAPVGGGAWHRCLYRLKGTGGGPVYCPLTVLFKDYYTGDPISGATITGYDAGGSVLGTATTDVDGLYTFGGAVGSGVSFSITWAGFTSVRYLFANLAADVYPCPPAAFCYCAARVTVTTPAGAAATIDQLGISPMAAGANVGGVIPITYQGIDFCSLHRFPFPRDILILATATAGSYIPNCLVQAVNCDDDLSVSLPMFEWSADYWSYVPSCDLGCPAGDTGHGEGPNYRGVTPKVLYAHWTATLISTGADVSSAYFGSYGGVDIPVTWNGTLWDSGCLDAGVPCSPGSPYGPAYLSNRTTIRPSIAFPAATPAVTWYDFAGVGCDPSVSGPPCVDQSITTGGVNFCDVTSPVDAIYTVDGGPAGTVRFTVHVHE